MSGLGTRVTKEKGRTRRPGRRRMKTKARRGQGEREERKGGRRREKNYRTQ